MEVPYRSRGRTRFGFVLDCRPMMEKDAEEQLRTAKHILRLATQEEYASAGVREPYYWM